MNHFEKKVRETIEKLIRKGDRVMVACSGGKDSTTALYLLKKFGYNPEALTINLEIGGWSKTNLQNLKKFCEDNGIKLNVVEMREEFGFSMCYIRSLVQSKTNLKSCTICGTIRRWMVNRRARELGATKLVTGHNLDDEAQSVLMNLFKNNIQAMLAMGPETGVIRDKKFVQRIKPLYFCFEKEIEEYSRKRGFPVLYARCPCSVDAFRRSFRNELDKLGPEVKRNIVNNLLKQLPFLRKKFKPEGKLRYCSKCGEPSRKEVCKVCGFVGIAREK